MKALNGDRRPLIELQFLTTMNIPDVPPILLALNIGYALVYVLCNRDSRAPTSPAVDEDAGACDAHSLSPDGAVGILVFIATSLSPTMFRNDSSLH